MGKKEYTYSVAYGILMVILPYTGIPFGFRRFLVSLLSVLFLAFVWYSRYRKTSGISSKEKQIIQEQVIVESTPTQYSETIITTETRNDPTVTDSTQADPL